MSEWFCKKCGHREFGSRFWRLRNATGGEITSRPNLAELRLYQRTFAWAKGSKIYRVTRRPREAKCYWPPETNPGFAAPVKPSKRGKRT